MKIFILPSSTPCLDLQDQSRVSSLATLNLDDLLVEG